MLDPARTAYPAARMSLLLDRPTAAAVQAVSQEATTQCQNRVAEFQSLLQETVQVHTRSDYLFQASLLSCTSSHIPSDYGCKCMNHIGNFCRRAKELISIPYACGLLVLPRGSQA